MSLSGHAANMAGIRNMYKILTKKGNVKETLGRQMAQMGKKH
jgi:hypothetical protein